MIKKSLLLDFGLMNWPKWWREAGSEMLPAMPLIAVLFTRAPRAIAVTFWFMGAKFSLGFGAFNEEPDK